jgi:hypothetical protein
MEDSTEPELAERPKEITRLAFSMWEANPEKAVTYLQDAIAHYGESERRAAVRDELQVYWNWLTGRATQPTAMEFMQFYQERKAALAEQSREGEHE